MDISPISTIVPSVQVFEDDKRNKRFTKKSKKKEKGKIHDVARSKMDENTAPNLLLTPEAPRIVKDLTAGFFKKKSQSRSRDLTENFIPYYLKPIGIERCPYYPWINSLMQLIIFVPSICEMFVYTHVKFQAFLDFIDGYRKEQIAGKKKFNVKPYILVKELRKHFPKRKLKHVHPYDILKDLMKSVEAVSGIQSDLLAQNSKGHLFLNQLEELNLDQNVSEYLLGLNTQALPHRSFLCLESHALKAFIELREERYITYVMTGDTWYQCDDDQVRAVRSNNLSIALRRGVLFYCQKLLD